MKIYGKKFQNSNVLEIGCHSGTASFLIAEKGAKKVVGTEFTEYKVKSLDGQDFENTKLEKVNNSLDLLRSQLAERSTHKENVEFLNDNICDSDLKGIKFDIILSWDVLEHLSDARSALFNMAELLEDDGIMIHEYNPFFALNGGHSLCTLDFFRSLCNGDSL